MIGLQVVALLGMALVVPGVVNRTKAWWAGRRGAPILQLVWDLRRLWRKEPVRSVVTTVVFQLAPWLGLGATVAGALVVPTLGARAPVSFPGDLVWLAYTTGLARAARALAALDTGSPFEGMGAARSAGFGVLVEPALFLLLGAGALLAGEATVSGALRFVVASPAAALAWVALAVALAMLVVVEASRMPVDDPTTHLELTMVHEVTILDHSGPELAALQLAGALELTTGLAMLVALLSPVALSPLAGALLWPVAVGLAAVALGTLESVVARIRMRAVPAWIVLAGSAAAAGLVLTLWVTG